MGGFALVRSGAVKTILRLFAVLLTALLALALVRQTAFAKTYVITDGDRVVIERREGVCWYHQNTQ